MNERRKITILYFDIDCVRPDLFIEADDWIVQQMDRIAQPQRLRRRAQRALE